MGEHHPAFEQYCEAIFELHEDDIDVIQARIAERLDISRPAVSEMIRRMADEGLVRVAGGSIGLTEAGTALAETIVRRHRLAERFLTDVLGLSWAEAHREAGRWEHVLSPSVEAAMTRVLGDPTTCPHGNPIPGSPYREPSHAVPMSQVAVGARFTVRRITEELEFTPGVLDYLEASAITPGATATLLSSAPDGSLVVRVGDADVGLAAYAGGRILVTVD
ncbi:MAG TPA: metal-dependent transcriptional regulator [Acidimicrobiales bacterium]|nr:metal-dependent transcriptional regulator [Acidimicrobiales bacterium]